ncbi:MAG: AraC family transcriptional regulator [Chloroflexota bacterium]
MDIIDFGFGQGYFNLNIFIKFNDLILDIESILFEKSSPYYDSSKNENTFIHPPQDTAALIYFSSGRGELYFEGSTYLINAGAFFLIPAGSFAYQKVIYEDHPIKHTIYFESKISGKSQISKRQNFYKNDVDQIKSHFINSTFQHGTLSPYINANYVFDNIQYELNSELTFSNASLTQLILNIFVNSARSFTNKINTSILDCNATTRQIINNIRFHMKQSYKSITLEDLAILMKFSRRQLQRYFSKYIKKTFSQLLEEFRISIAKKEIQTSQKSLHQIADDIGFKTYNSFKNSFLKQTNQTPDNYCEQMRKVKKT